MKKALIIILVIVVLLVGIPSSISLVRAFLPSDYVPSIPFFPNEPEEPVIPEEPEEPVIPEEPEEPVTPEEPEEPVIPDVPVAYESRTAYLCVDDNKLYYTNQLHNPDVTLNPLDYEEIEILHIEWAMYSFNDVYQFGYNEKSYFLEFHSLFTANNWMYEQDYVKIYPANSVTAYNSSLYLNGNANQLVLSWLDETVSKDIDDYIRVVDLVSSSHTVLGAVAVLLQPFTDDVVMSCTLPTYSHSLIFKCEV